MTDKMFTRDPALGAALKRIAHAGRRSSYLKELQ